MAVELLRRAFYFQDATAYEDILQLKREWLDKGGLSICNAWTSALSSDGNVPSNHNEAELRSTHWHQGKCRKGLRTSTSILANQILYGLRFMVSQDHYEIARFSGCLVIRKCTLECWLLLGLGYYSIPNITCDATNHRGH